MPALRSLDTAAQLVFVVISSNALAAAGVGCGNGYSAEVSESHHAILGGAPVDGDWPNVVWLGNCTAVVIAEHVVVFSGHCGAEHDAIWLGDEFTAVVDSDDRAVHVPDAAQYDRVPTLSCRVHPSGDIGTGLDVGYCITELPMAGPRVPPLTTVDSMLIRKGMWTTLVGYGFSGPGGEGFGIKRATRAQIRQVGREIVIGDLDAGTCLGDSGGPAFIRTEEFGGTQGPRDEWRLLGVLSSGEVGVCGRGWYTDISRVIGWIQEDSGLELVNEPSIGAIDIDASLGSRLDGGVARQPQDSRAVVMQTRIGCAMRSPPTNGNEATAAEAV